MEEEDIFIDKLQIGDNLKTCPRCDWCTRLDHAKSCNRCGCKLIEIFCPNCSNTIGSGHDNGLSDRFCEVCGTYVALHIEKERARALGIEV